MRKLIFLIFFLFLFVTPALAQGGCPPGTVPSASTGGRGGITCISPCTNGVDTALGCIPTEPAALVKWILQNAVFMGGGIAFLLSVWGGLTIMLAGGNPEKINEGKEIIGSAVTGLLFIIFSVFLLRLIGLNILQIPDFK